tara:strand:- start:106 stop:939 length:834 start_codon:yes stop_codon:yes gene_type:complete
MPNISENSISSLNMLAQDFGIDNTNNNFPIASIANSNSILDQIYIKSFKQSHSESLITLPEILKTDSSNILENSLSIFFKNSGKSPESIKYNTIKKFKDERLQINYDRRTNITSISVELEDPKVASQVAELFYIELSSFINETINKGARIKQNFLNERIDSIELELLSSEKNLEDFLNENKSFQNSPKLLQDYNRLQRDVKLKETAFLLLKNELEIAKVDEVKNTLKLVMIDKPSVPFAKSYPSRLSLSLSIAFLVTVLYLLLPLISEIRRNNKTFN